MKFKVTLLFITSCFFLQAQKALNVQIYDVQKRPVPSALIKYAGFTFNADEAGFFRIANYKPETKITIHKFGFADTLISLAATAFKSDSLFVTITLRLKPMVLPEVAINSGEIHELNPLKADFLLGYELKGEYLLELLSDDFVLVINTDNQVKSHAKYIRGATDIVKDSDGQIYLITDKTAYKIYSDSSFIRIDSVPADHTKLKWNLQYCDETTPAWLFVRRYKDNNQTVAFFAMSRFNKNDVSLLKEISDAHRKNAVAIFAAETAGLNHYVESLGLSMVTANIENIELVRKAQNMTDRLEMNYALPSYSFLKMVNDSIYLFAHDIDSMFVYDQNGDLARSKRIRYHHLKTWGKELIVNEERTRVYAKLIENSKPVLAEIDLHTGELKPNYIILGAGFPSKIKIRNNVVYFMAKQKNGSGYTLYAQHLKE